MHSEPGPEPGSEDSVSRLRRFRSRHPEVRIEHHDAGYWHAMLSGREIGPYYWLADLLDRLDELVSAS